MKEESIQASKEVSSMEGRKDATKQANKQTNKQTNMQASKQASTVGRMEKGYGMKIW